MNFRVEQGQEFKSGPGFPVWDMNEVTLKAEATAKRAIGFGAAHLYELAWNRGVVECAGGVTLLGLGLWMLLR